MKERSTYLFSYGTLQLAQVQIETYGRLLTGEKDILPYYKIEQLEITNPDVLAKSGKKYHPIAIKTKTEHDHIHGTIYEITEAELLATDLYEVGDYTRVLETFLSGKQAWVYVKKFIKT